MPRLDSAAAAEDAGGEVVSLPISRVAQSLAVGWRAIAATALLAAVVGYAASFAFSDQFESELNLRIGSAFGIPAEDARIVADLIKSEGFRLSLSGSLKTFVRRRAVGATVVGGSQPPARDSSYVQVVVRGESAEQAAQLIAAIERQIVERHAPVLEQVTAHATAFQAQLREGIARLDAELAAMQQRLTAGSTAQNAIPALLLMSNTASVRVQQLDLRRQLRESEIAESVSTYPTQAVGPATPALHVWPKRGLFAAGAGALGALVACGVLVAIRPDRRRQ